jgi:CubicO group peptidase (beta-lactamase class C family)
VSEGKLELGRPVADYWPEFGVGGKENVTVAQLFSHQAGLCGPETPLSEAEFLDTDHVADVLAHQTPHWPIGTRSGYHALSIGPLADGLFKRVVGKSVGAYFRDEIGSPLHVDFLMGFGANEDGRVAELVHDGQPISGGHEPSHRYQTLAHRARRRLRVMAMGAASRRSTRRWRPTAASRVSRSSARPHSPP